MDALIRKYGYTGRLHILDVFREPGSGDLRGNMGAAAHLDFLAGFGKNFAVCFGIAQTVQKCLLAAGKCPSRSADLESGAGSFPGILVDRQIVAQRAEIVDLCDGLMDLSPVGLAQHLVVGNVHLNTGLTANIDGLLHSVHNEVGFVPHVAGIGAAEGSDDLGQLDNLLFLRVAAGGIDKAGGESGGTGFHGFPQNALHGVQLFVRRGAIFHTHDRNAQSAVANIHFGVGGELLGVGILQVPGKAAPVFHVLREPGGAHREHILGCGQILRHDRCHGQAALAYDLCRHALGGFEQVGILRPEDQISVGMGIDESGGKASAGSIDGMLCRGLSLEKHQLPSVDPYISHVGGGTAAVNDSGVFDQVIQHKKHSLPFGCEASGLAAR